MLPQTLAQQSTAFVLAYKRLSYSRLCMFQPQLMLQMGTTLDDSIGEAFDKVARMLGLDAMPSGGPALEEFAKHGDPYAVPLTMPLRTKRTCDFSYSGLKTAVVLATEGRGTNCPTPENFQVQCHVSVGSMHVVQHPAPGQVFLLSA